MLRLLLLVASAAAFFVPAMRQPVVPRFAIVDGADCVDENSCTVEELNDLLLEVKAKAAEIKELESKLTALNKGDSETLKKMLAAEECELNGFDGCAAWYYDD